MIDRKYENLNDWAYKILKSENIISVNGEIVLVTLPRVFGYVFNPVSFWFCLDEKQNLRAVICEVNNTFGETHTYICAHKDERPIAPEDILEGKKVFHVSPFMEREGHYRFRFYYNEDKMHTRIDYYDEDRSFLHSLGGIRNEY